MSKQFARMMTVGMLVLVSTSRVASAQISPIAKAADPNAELGEEAPIKFKGFTLNVTLQDGSALNIPNYSNQFYGMVEPSWALGKYAVPKSKYFHRLTAGLRIPIMQSVAGYDPVAAGSRDLGALQSGCSNAKINEAGILDPKSVGHCAVSQSYRPTPGDISLYIADPGIYTIPEAKIRLNPSIRFNFPLSYESRYSSMIMSAQASLGFGRTFFDNKLSVGYQFGAAKIFNKYTSAGAETTSTPLPNGYVQAYSMKDVQANSDSFYATNNASAGGLNTSYSLSNVFSLGYTFTDKFSMSAMYMVSSAFAYDSGNSCPTKYGDVVTDPCKNADAVANAQSGQGTVTQGIRNNQYFMLSGAYQLQDWLGVYASWTTFSPFKSLDGHSWRQPFVSVDYNAYSTVNVGATFTMGYMP